uniref:Antibiotic transport system permease protein n=1 Tax=Acetithermum autotrophicum TaxID=1446466 RepID=H5SSK4_ACEAU|nr:antibiotic transport system permease protein [Candidatus Acetothermum autotrophicum]
MTLVRQISAIVLLDFFDFWRVRWVIAGFVSIHITDALIVLVVLDRLIPLNYIRFALPGIAASAVTLAALDQSRKVFWEFQARTHYYFRALPFQPIALVLARLIGAAVKASAYSLGLVVPVAILGSIDLGKAAVSVAAILFAGMGVGALGVAISTVIREFGAWSAANSLLALILVTVSTAFYPLHVLELVSPLLAMVAAINPVSSVADILRWAFGPIEISDLGAVVTRPSLVLLVLIALGGWLYRLALVRGW